MLKTLVIGAVAFGALAGCQTTTNALSAVSADAVAASDAAITQKFAGATFTNLDNGTVVNANADGTLTGGGGLSGTWAIKNGQWCRTLTAPAAYAGSECQKMVIAGNVMTLTRADGSIGRYSF